MAFIDPWFRSVVRSHLVGNLAVQNTLSPLILAIFGPPGEGKTFQTEAVCNELGLKPFIVSPGELESENAGHPGQVLRQQYLAAGSTRSSSRGVLVINDVDTVLGDWGQLVQYTVNRQVVYAQLMAFCDYPAEVAGNSTTRVPIILTGNDPSILYGPLLRPGRARVARWEPNIETKLPIVGSIFPELDRESIRAILEKLPEQPVSFWSDVRAALWEAKLDDWIAPQRPAELARLLSMRSQVRLDGAIGDLSSVTSIALKLGEDRTLKRSFLRQGDIGG